MNRAMIGSLAIATALAITGCSVDAPTDDTGKTPDTAPVAESPQPQPSATEDEEPSEFGAQDKSPRGSLIKDIGQLAGTGIYEDPNIIGSRFVVTDIILDPDCDSGWADPPANGHYLALHINVETTPELAQSESVMTNGGAVTGWEWGYGNV
ncbi:MAG TPA: hypothetical protein DIW46_01975 [Microbacterium sp.]|nr:hypothetical protein [Microbacterium sp.]